VSSSTPAPSSRSLPPHTVIDQSSSSRPTLESSWALLLSLSAQAHCCCSTVMLGWDGGVD
jgi:hypothetical protein